MPELPLVGDEFAGYRLRAVLGRGGMSVVYQAENPRLGNVIALKVLSPELATDDAFRARFLEESRIAASLNHPNVIPIYDVGSGGGLLYIAMRYVPGTDLRQMIRKRGRILPSTAVSLVGQAARALDAAHQGGLVHRDVKPGNLLIEQSSDDDPDHVYLADFGLTKHAMSRSGLTSTGQFLGTVDYVAPEQILGMSVLGSADQYSLGCVLYECLTGRVPFEKDLDAAIIWAHVEESPKTPTELRPDLPPAVDDVFARVLAKQPGDRYGSCREFVEATRAALGSLAAEPQAGGSLGSNALDLLPEPAAERVAAGAQAVQAHEGDTMASHRRQAAGAPPGEKTGDHGGHHPSPGHQRPRRWFLRPGWIAALAALILIAAGAGTWALVSGEPASHARSTAMTPSTSAKPKAPTSALMSALILANQSGAAKGLLPPSTCKQQSTTMVTCTAPAPGITGVVFRTYPSLTALYAAYTAFVKSLNSGQFTANFQDCGMNDTYGEVAWNHMFQHPKTYSVTQMSMGTVPDGQAAGRVFCNFSNGQESFVWTQDDGHLLAYVTGAVHEDVWNWWIGVHHNIGFAGSPVHM
jgi:Protein kinase domain